MYLFFLRNCNAVFYGENTFKRKLFFINYSHFDNDSYTLMVTLTQEMEDQTKLSFYGISSQFPLP